MVLKWAKTLAHAHLLLMNSMLMHLYKHEANKVRFRGTSLQGQVLHQLRGKLSCNTITRKLVKSLTSTIYVQCSSC